MVVLPVRRRTSSVVAASHLATKPLLRLVGCRVRPRKPSLEHPATTTHDTASSQPTYGCRRTVTLLAAPRVQALMDRVHNLAGTR